MPSRLTSSNKRMKKDVARDRGQYSKFADYYDSIYNQIVDYESQTSFLERIFERFRKGKVKSILDVGCGTGNFTLQFAKRGYETVGIDLSKDMIRIAKKKARGDNPQFFQMDMRSVKLGGSWEGKKFDAATVLFGGFGYLIEYSDVSEFLRGVKEYLRRGGLLVFEFWHVGGVRPETSSKTGYVTWQKVEEGDRVIIRLDASKYDPRSNTSQVLFDFYVIDRRARELVDSFTETHRLKLYSMSEISNLLERHGYAVLGFFKDSPGAATGEMEKAEQDSFRILAVATPR